MADEPEGRWLSVNQICQYLGVSSDNVYRWLDRSAVPVHRMGWKWKFNRDQFDLWVEAGCAADDAREGGAK